MGPTGSFCPSSARFDDILIELYVGAEPVRSVELYSAVPLRYQLRCLQLSAADPMGFVELFWECADLSQLRNAGSPQLGNSTNPILPHHEPSAQATQVGDYGGVTLFRPNDEGRWADPPT